MGKVIVGFTMSLHGFVNDQNGSVERLHPDLDAWRYAKPLQESIEKTGANAGTPRRNESNDSHPDAPVVSFPCGGHSLARTATSDRRFALATYLITVAVAGRVLMAMLTALQARATVSRDALPGRSHAGASDL
jgi:hypothetical protein